MDSTPDDFMTLIKDINRALEADSRQATAYMYRGLCYYAAGRTEQAQADLRLAVRLIPELADDVARLTSRLDGRKQVMSGNK